jgi:hypothetical protein
MKTKDIQMAKQSLKEEKKAVKDYSRRKKATKAGILKKVFNHAIPEEKEHSGLFKKAIKKIGKK